MTAYDNVDWHLDEDFPPDLGRVAAGTHIGLYVWWLAERGLVDPAFARDHADAVAALRAGQLSGSAFLLEHCDGVFQDDLPSAEGRAFTRAYYEQSYLDDYVDLSDDELPTIYHEPDTASKRAVIRQLLDQRFAEWQRERVVDFRLGNAEEYHAAAPRSFHIPARADREGLEIGESVKLIFECIGQPSHVPGGERMWVTITAREGDGYVGTLNNEPNIITTIDRGDTVRFGPEHVASTEIDWELWEKNVSLLRRLDEADIRPALLERTEWGRDSHSGWIVYPGDAVEAEFADSSLWMTRPVGHLCALWPEIEDVMRSADRPGWWRWDEQSGTYVSTEDGLLP